MNIPYIIMLIQVLAIFVLFVELLFTMCQKPSEMQSHIVVLLISTMVMFAGYVIELNAANVETALAGTVFAYLGKPFVMLSSLMTICTFYNVKVSKALHIGLSIYCTVFSVLVFTNDYHHLYYATVSFNINNAYSPLMLTRGPLYYLYMATAIIYFVACIAIIVTNYGKINNRSKRSLTVYLTIMVASGIAGYLIYLSGLSKGYDATMAGVFGSVICLFVVFTRYHIFDTLAFVKNEIVNVSTTGLLVFDQHNEIAYRNETAKAVMDKGLSLKELENLKEGNTKVTIQGLNYALCKKKVMEEKNFLGYSVEILDVTTSANYQNRLEVDVKERTEKLETVQRQIVASVANIIESRSIESSEHIHRTSRYVNLIANALKDAGYYDDILTDEYIRLLVSVAPLHDIGKISVPDYILLKPGKLTENEFEIIKTHTTAGAEIIEKAMRNVETDDYVNMAEDVALYHHERRDGKGYPKGLFGNQIPLSARIVSLADAYDALIGDDSESSPRSKKEALDIIRNEAGGRFDSNIVDVFVKTVEELDAREAS